MGGESITRSCSAQNEGAGAVIKLGEVMILDIHLQGPTVSAIARELGIDRKDCSQMHHSWPRAARLWPTQAARAPDRFIRLLFARAGGRFSRADRRRLLRELREHGYEGGYTAVTDVLRELRPAPLQAFEVRFETPPGDQRRSTLLSSRCSSLTSRRSLASSGCSPLCSASAG